MGNSILISGGLKLLVCGMGMVYVFLVIMIAVMHIMEKVLSPLARHFEEPQPVKSPVPAQAGAEAEKLAAIAVAVVENAK